MNQKGVDSYASSSSISAHVESTVDVDDHSLRHSLIEVELNQCPREPA
jgi:hypothetical protein